MPAPERAMLDYALKLSLHAAEVSKADIQGLRDVGFGDAAILDICQITSYYNYVNRLADGLAVELESWWQDEDLTMSRAEFENARRRARASGTERRDSRS